MLGRVSHEFVQPPSTAVPSAKGNPRAVRTASKSVYGSLIPDTKWIREGSPEMFGTVHPA